MPKFFIYDTRNYAIEAADEDAAFKAFTDMSDAEARAIETDGGNIEIEAAK